MGDGSVAGDELLGEGVVRGRDFAKTTVESSCNAWPLISTKEELFGRHRSLHIFLCVNSLFAFLRALMAWRSGRHQLWIGDGDESLGFLTRTLGILFVSKGVDRRTDIANVAFHDTTPLFVNFLLRFVNSCYCSHRMKS